MDDWIKETIEAIERDERNKAISNIVYGAIFSTAFLFLLSLIMGS